MKRDVSNKKQLKKVNHYPDLYELIHSITYNQNKGFAD